MLPITDCTTTVVSDNHVQNALPKVTARFSRSRQTYVITVDGFEFGTVADRDDARALKREMQQDYRRLYGA
jgi:hypothetical protein